MKKVTDTFFPQPRTLAEKGVRHLFSFKNKPKDENQIASSIIDQIAGVGTSAKKLTKKRKILRLWH